MSTIVIDKRALQATALASAVLIFKFVITLGIQGSARVKAGSRPPEDAKLFPKAGNQSFDGSKKFAGKEDDAQAKFHKEHEMRWLRIVSNDLENIPIGVALSWGAVLTPFSPLLHAGLVLLFAAARVMHTYSYANSLQPHRALCWTAGILCSLAIAVNALLGAFLL